MLTPCGDKREKKNTTNYHVYHIYRANQNLKSLYSAPRHSSYVCLRYLDHLDSFAIDIVFHIFFGGFSEVVVRF